MIDAADHSHYQKNKVILNDEKGVKISGIITSKRKLTREEIDSLRKAWALRHVGTENAFKHKLWKLGFEYEEFETPKGE